MKQLLISTICGLAFFSFLGGCSNNEQSEKPMVDSGILDENYVGDADVQLEENYKQTAVEAEIQDNLLKEMEAKKVIENEDEGSGGGHF